jgi:hypothetical protein
MIKTSQSDFAADSDGQTTATISCAQASSRATGAWDCSGVWWPLGLGAQPSWDATPAGPTAPLTTSSAQTPCATTSTSQCPSASGAASIPCTGTAACADICISTDENVNSDAYTDPWADCDCQSCRKVPRRDLTQGDPFDDAWAEYQGTQQYADNLALAVACLEARIDGKPSPIYADEPDLTFVDGSEVHFTGTDHVAAAGTVWDLVVRDMHGRDALGMRKYGRPLLPHDGRDTLQDAYEEALDLAVYLRKAMLERDGK